MLSINNNNNENNVYNIINEGLNNINIQNNIS